VVLTSPEGVDENNGGRDDYGPTKTLHYLFDWNSLLPLHDRDRVARFFSVQNTQNGKNIPNDNKMYQKAIKYTILA
jgi:hypothetical protein